MPEYLPLALVSAMILAFTAVFLAAWFAMRGRFAKADDDRHMNDRELIRRLLACAKPYKKEFAAVFLTILLSITYDIASPLLVSRIEGLFGGAFALSELYAIVAVYIGILAVSMIATYLQAMILQTVGQKILTQLRLELFSHIEGLSHAQLNSMPVGKLVTRVGNDPNAISYLFTNILVTMLKNVLVIFGVLAAMLVLNSMLTLIILGFIPFLVIFTLIFQKFSREVHRNVNNARTEINTFLSENLSGMHLIQAFCRENARLSAFLRKSGKLQRAKLSRVAVFGVFRPMVYMLYVSASLFLFYIACSCRIRGTDFLGQTITAETVVAFYMYITKFFNPIQAIAEQFDMLEQSFASAEKIFTVLDTVPALVDAPDAAEPAEFRGEIEFRNVWFAYKPGEWVLQDVSFHVLPGETAAFVGATGSGKTTILSLLCRNYDIQRGRILLDGADIRTLRLSWLRTRFGQMLQDVFLFSGDIRGNILLRAEGISEEELWEACRYVNADSFISRLDKGLAEPVLERGGNFSAGQRQLISFARAVVHRPSAMILDEATANIDPETELLIRSSMERMKNIGTMLIVAHRLSTIRYADRIFVLSHGRILERGTHEELLRNNGPYARLYEVQSEGESLLKER